MSKYLFAGAIAALIAGPAFAHQPHALAAIQGKADAVDGRQVAEPKPELDFKIVDFQ